MNVKTNIDNLWNEMRGAINTAYENDKQGVLRDYAQNVAWSDNLAVLLSRETANERQHRNGHTVRNFSPETASKLILMNNVLSGSKSDNMPLATDFLQFRQTAVEAQVIGFLIREFLTYNWCESIITLNYSKIMESAREFN